MSDSCFDNLGQVVPNHIATHSQIPSFILWRKLSRTLGKSGGKNEGAPASSHWIWPPSRYCLGLLISSTNPSWLEIKTPWTWRPSSRHPACRTDESKRPTPTADGYNGRRPAVANIIASKAR